MSTDDTTVSEAADRATLLEASAAACREAALRFAAITEPAVRYVRERRAKGIAADVAQLARERPEQALAAAALLGAVVGGALYGLSRRGR